MFVILDSRIMECSKNIIVTEEPIFKYYFENVSYVDYKDKNLSKSLPKYHFESMDCLNQV